MMDQSPHLKPLRWIGTSKRDLKALPKPVEDLFGFALYLAQVGKKHEQAKPLKGFGSAGVLEVTEDWDRSTYRAVYTVRFKAAVFVFKRHLHTVTLLVFPADGLPWSSSGLTRLGRLSISEETSRGFSVLLWREEGLGYALISDVSRPDLELLASRINTE